MQSNDIVFVEFTQTSCQPSHELRPVFEQAAERHDDHTFLVCDTEEQPELARAFGVSEVPTLAAVRDGIMVFRQAGKLPAEAIDMLVDNVERLDMDEIRSEIEAQQASSAEEG
jgi:thioredoxin-like negative regulator of GroEL